MRDSYYTPPELARTLVKHIQKRKPQIVADFCAGNGELLRAARDRWANTALVATDISPSALRKIRSQHENWSLGQCDFLSEASRNQCKVLRHCLGCVDIILLNPPFSCIGGTKHQVILDGRSFTGSIAMAFLVTSLPYRSKKGVIFSILPSSAAYSEKDHNLWTALVKNYKLKILYESDDQHFDGCSPNIVLVSLNADVDSCASPRHRKIPIKLDALSLYRGKIPMSNVAKAPAAGITLVHSTSLQTNSIIDLKHRVKVNGSRIMGPAVLFPRVGTPRKDKICVLPSRKSVALSDCVMAIRTKTVIDSRSLMASIIHHWDVFSAQYQGTGAKYITLARIKNIFYCKN